MGVYISALSTGAYTTTLNVMVDIVKRVGVHPPPSPIWANFSIKMEFTSDSGCCHSVYSVYRNIDMSPFPIYLLSPIFLGDDKKKGGEKRGGKKEGDKEKG